MTGELWLLAIAFGLTVSATLHLIFIWPAYKPDDEPPAGPAHDPTASPESSE